MNLNEAKYKINKDIPIPFYYQVKRMILNELSNGSLQQGDKLPGETEFCECLGLSRPTVRQALNELVSEGVLVRKKKSGTFVAQPKIELKTGTGIEHLKYYLERSSRECTVEVLDLCIMDGIEEINQRLELENHAPLIYLKRMWKVGETPIVYSATYVSADRFQAVLKKDFREMNLFDVLELEYGIRAESRTVKIEATLASKYDLELLEINRTRAPLLCVTDVISEEEGQPVCYSVTRYRGDKSHISYDCEA